MPRSLTLHHRASLPATFRLASSLFSFWTPSFGRRGSLSSCFTKQVPAGSAPNGTQQPRSGRGKQWWSTACPFEKWEIIYPVVHFQGDISNFSSKVPVIAKDRIRGVSWILTFSNSWHTLPVKCLMQSTCSATCCPPRSRVKEKKKERTSSSFTVRNFTLFLFVLELNLQLPSGQNSASWIKYRQPKCVQKLKF